MSSSFSRWHAIEVGERGIGQLMSIRGVSVETPLTARSHRLLEVGRFGHGQVEGRKPALYLEVQLCLGIQPAHVFCKRQVHQRETGGERRSMQEACRG